MDTNAKMKLRVGDAELDFEGPAELLKTALESFVRSLTPAAGAGDSKGARKSQDAEPEPPPARQPKPFAGRPDNLPSLDSVFNADGKFITLTRLPAQQSESLLLVLYGYRRLRNLNTVKASALKECLKISGHGNGLERLDGFLAPLEGLVHKSGTRRGSQYGLTNQGLVRAEELLAGFES